MRSSTLDLWLLSSIYMHLWKLFQGGDFVQWLYIKYILLYTYLYILKRNSTSFDLNSTKLKVTKLKKELINYKLWIIILKYYLLILLFIYNY